MPKGNNPPPSTINILGTPYTVRRVPYIGRDGFVMGEIRHEEQEIVILDTLKDQLAGIALLHEIVHGILTHLRYDETCNEKLVQGLAIGLYQALGECPAVAGARCMARPTIINKKLNKKRVLWGLKS
jgi:hypothetical protein